MSGIEGGERVECGTRACALNFSLIGMCREKVCGIPCGQGFMHLNCFVHMQLSSFVCTLCFSRNSTQGFVYEAPDKEVHSTCEAC